MRYSKKKNGVGSRKITKFVTKKHQENEEDNERNLNECVRIVKQKLSKYGPENCFNMDQSGKVYEWHGARTLSFKGERNIYGKVRSSHSTTHSHTFQPLLSASGELIGPLFIILKDDSQSAVLSGPRMFRHHELNITAHRSGKITKEILKKWFEDIYFEETGRKTCLLLDSLKTHADTDYYFQEKPGGVTCEVIIIPPGLTGEIQPLYVFFFRLYKAFYNKISEEIFVKYPDYKIHLRNSILRLHAATFFQNRHARFKQGFQHAWVMAGYIEENIARPYFETPAQYCFTPDRLQTPCSLCSGQSNSSFIRCAWCEKFFCVFHFVLDDKIHHCQPREGCDLPCCSDALTTDSD